MKTYNPTPKKTDPLITIRVPSAILKDLALRSVENGTTIEVELSMRLARTLERDLEMIEEDNQWAYAAFKVVHEENRIL